MWVLMGKWYSGILDTCYGEHLLQTVQVWEIYWWFLWGHWERSQDDEVEVEVYNERENKGKHCKGKVEGKQVKKLNNKDCKKWKGWKGNQPALQFTDGQSEDHPIYSWGFIYISTICTYVALLTS